MLSISGTVAGDQLQWTNNNVIPVATAHSSLDEVENEEEEEEEEEEAAAAAAENGKEDAESHGAIQPTVDSRPRFLSSSSSRRRGIQRDDCLTGSIRRSTSSLSRGSKRSGSNHHRRRHRRLLHGIANSNSNSSTDEITARLNGAAGSRCSCARAAAFIVTGLVLMCDGQEMLVMGLVTPQLRRQWQLGTLAEGSLGASVFGGVLIGSLTGGLLSDAWGRRSSLLLFAALLSVFGSAAAFAPNLWSLIVLRTLAGVALGGTLPITSALLAEISSDKWRGALMILGGLGFVIGEVVTAAEAAVMDLSKDERQWRVLMGVSAIPAFLCLLVAVPFLQESPRWYDTKGQAKKAMQALDALEGKTFVVFGRNCRKPARHNKVSAGTIAEARPLLPDGPMPRGTGSRSSVTQHAADKSSWSDASETSIDAVTSDSANEMNINNARDGSVEWRARAAANPCGRVFLATGCANTWLLWTVWWVCSVVYYGIVWILPSTLGEASPSSGSTSTGLAAQQKVSLEVLASAGAELVGIIGPAVFLNCIGRRNMMMGALAFSTVLAVICAIYAPSPATDIPAHSGFVATVSLLKMFISVVFTVIYVYTAELYSSAERGTAIGAGSAASRVGGIFTPFISTALHHVGAGIPFYLFSAASLFGLIALFILPIAPTSIR